MSKGSPTGITVPSKLPDGTPNPEYCRQYKALTKAVEASKKYRKKWIQTPQGQAYLAKVKARRQSPEGKAALKAYRERPQVRATLKAAEERRRKGAIRESPDTYASRIIREVEAREGDD